MGKHTKFLQSDVTRAVRGAIKGGATVVRTEIAPDGRILMFHTPEADAEASPFDSWKARRDAR